MTKDKIDLKQLHITLPMHADLHKNLKMRVLEQNKTLKEWFFEAINEKLKREEELGWK